jgi:hypothetical protein
MPPSQCIIVDSCLAQLSQQFQGGSAIVSKFSLLLSEYINVYGLHVQAWRPYLRKDIELIEEVQRRATKLKKSLKDETYEYRLKSFI